MMLSTRQTAMAACAILLIPPALDASPKNKPAAVPPSMEIAIIDPNADPVGDAAVELVDDGTGLKVDIPPVLMVHRYYYSGSRTFQGPMIPGGPTILVVNHPKTGERCYIPATMMPGAPKVTYTPNSIEYDYITHAITLEFGIFGKPKLKFRNGKTLRTKLGESLEAVDGQSVKNTVGLVEGTVDTVTTPVRQVLRVLPFAKWFNKPAGEEGFGARYMREKAIRKSAEASVAADATRPTLR